MYTLQHVLLIITVMQYLRAHEDLYNVSNQRNKGNIASTSHTNLQLERKEKQISNVDSARFTRTYSKIPENERFRDGHTTIKSYVDGTPSTTNRYFNLSEDQNIKNNSKRKSVEYDEQSRMLYPSDMENLSRNCSFGLCDEVDEYPFEKIQRILRQSELKKFFSTETIRIDSRFGDDFENLCTSITHTRFPKTAKNLHNVEQVIVNVDQYKQGIIFETCTNEGPCNFADNFPNNFTPKCVQKYTVRKLMVVGKETDNAVFDDFKIPSCCVCMVKK